jgi:hypothetical protein
MQARVQIVMLTLVAVAGGLAGCSTTGGPTSGTTPTIDPIGQYRFDFVDRGESSTGTATITGTPGSHTGTVTFDDGRPDTPISAVATSGNLMIVTADIPGALLVMRLRFDGNAFTGDWVMGRGVGTISGTRLGAER